MSLRLRVTLLAAAVVAIVVAVFGTGVYLVYAGRSIAQVDDRLTARADGFVTGGRLPFLPDLRTAPTSDLPRPGRFGPANELGIFLLSHGSDGTVVSRSLAVGDTQVPVPASVWQSALSGGSPTVTVANGGQSYRLTIRAVPEAVRPGTVQGAAFDTAAGQPIDAFAVGTSISDVESTLSTLRLILLAGGLLAIALAAAGTWLVSRRALAPVSKLVAAAETIGAGRDLGRRLPPPGSRDEIGRLTVAFNGSLARVEAAFTELEALLDQQRRFVADASHELRTPLTTLRTDLGALRRHLEIPTAERAAVLDDALLELERLSRLVTDLLTLARVDAEALVRPAPLSWDQVAADAAQDAERVCAPRSVTLEVAGRLGTGAGDADALRRAVRALLENVAHHTPPSSHVWLVARGEPETVELHVEDNGPGVPAELVPHLFDRFVQADASRHTAGSGLGLAIARGIVEAHHGTIAARPRRGGGLVVAIRLPRGEDGEDAPVAPEPDLERTPVGV